MAHLSRPPLIIILGPTASGKTNVALSIAQEYSQSKSGIGIEILSADSRQIYIGMNIGTAKPCTRSIPPASRYTPLRCHGVSHYLIDILYPDSHYSAAEFRSDARAVATDISARGNIPMIVGGTGFYARVFTEDQLLPHVPPDPAFRAWAKQQSRDVILSEIQQRDVDAAKRVAHLDHRRAVRALEIARHTHATNSPQPSIHTSFDIHKIALVPEKVVLTQTIEKRVDAMFKQGLVEEVRTLVQFYSEQAPGLQAIGYRELFPFLNGNASLQEVRESVVCATKQYAKRQCTWLKKEPNVQFVTTPEEALSAIRNILQ